MFYEITRVVNKHHEDYDVLIQRGTKWGNPYKEGSLDYKLSMFSEYFLNQIRSGHITYDDLKELRGKRLGCSCKPKRCHGDFIAECVELLFSDLYSRESKEKYFNMEIKLDNEY